MASKIQLQPHFRLLPRLLPMYENQKSSRGTRRCLISAIGRRSNRGWENSRANCCWHSRLARNCAFCHSRKWQGMTITRTASFCLFFEPRLCPGPAPSTPPVRRKNPRLPAPPKPSKPHWPSLPSPAGCRHSFPPKSCFATRQEEITAWCGRLYARRLAPPLALLPRCNGMERRSRSALRFGMFSRVNCGQRQSRAGSRNSGRK